MRGKSAEPAYNDKKFEYTVRCSRSKMGLTNPFNGSDLAHAEAYSVAYRFMLHAAWKRKCFLFAYAPRHADPALTLAAV